MPWNDNANPGPWGSPPQGDDGKPDDDHDGRAQSARREEPRRRSAPPPPPRGPNLNDWLGRAADGMRRYFGGASGRGVRPAAVAAVFGVLFLLWTLTGAYSVQPYEEAVITRFGVYDRSTGPGLHYHLPIPMEQARLVNVTGQRKTVIGGDAGAQDTSESLMLTGDQNIVDLSFTVQWHVADAPAYVFKIRDPETAVKAVAESAMREVVGRNELQAILTNGRGKVQNQTIALMQHILDGYDSGVNIDAVQIQTASPPPEVVPAFQDIAKSLQDAQRAQNEANTYRNQKVTEAKGTASQIVADAQAYREQVVRQAEGDARAFNIVYEQYKRAPAVTRQRLYIETMQDVLAHSNKVVIDAKGSTAPIILPPDVFKPRSEAAPPAPPPAPTQQQAPSQ